MPVRVQTEDFDLSAEIARLRAGNPNIGAVASFVGSVVTVELQLPPVAAGGPASASVKGADARVEFQIA